MSNTKNKNSLQSLKIDIQVIFKSTILIIKEILKSKFQDDQKFQDLLENLEKDFEKINEKKYEDGKDYSKKDKNNEYIKILNEFIKNIDKKHEDLSLSLTSVINRINNFKNLTIKDCQDNCFSKDFQDNFFNKKDFKINENNIEYIKVIAVTGWNLQNISKVLDDQSIKQTIEEYIEQLKNIKTIENTQITKIKTFLTGVIKKINSSFEETNSDKGSDSGFSDNDNTNTSTNTSDNESNSGQTTITIKPNLIKEPEESFNSDMESNSGQNLEKTDSGFSDNDSNYNTNTSTNTSDNEFDSEQNSTIKKIDPNSIKEPDESFITKEFINQTLKEINKIEYSLENIIENFNEISEEKIERIDKPGILKKSLSLINSIFSSILHPVDTLESALGYDPYKNNPADRNEIDYFLKKTKKISDILSPIKNFFEIQYAPNENIENNELEDLTKDFPLSIEKTLDNGNLKKKISLLSEIQDSLTEISKYCNIEFKTSYKTFQEQISEFESFCTKVSSSFLETNTEFIKQIKKLNENELTKNSRYLKNQFYLLKSKFDAIIEIFKDFNKDKKGNKKTIENLESLKSNIKNNGFDLKKILEKFYESKTKVIQQKIIQKFQEIITHIQIDENNIFLNSINEDFKNSIESNNISKLKNTRINFIHYCENHNIFNLIEKINQEFVSSVNINQNYLEELENTLDFFNKAKEVFKENKKKSKTISTKDSNTDLLNKIKSQILQIPEILLRNFSPNYVPLNTKLDEILKSLFFSSYKYTTKQEKAIEKYKEALSDLSKLVNSYIDEYNETIDNYNDIIDKLKNINEEKKSTIENIDLESLLTQDNPNYNCLLEKVKTKLDEVIQTLIKDEVEPTLTSDKSIQADTLECHVINDENKIDTKLFNLDKIKNGVNSILSKLYEDNESNEYKNLEESIQDNLTSLQNSFKDFENKTEEGKKDCIKKNIDIALKTIADLEKRYKSKFNEDIGQSTNNLLDIKNINNIEEFDIEFNQRLKNIENQIDEKQKNDLLKSSSTLSSDENTKILKDSIINLDLYNPKTIKISYILLSISLIILAFIYYFLSYAMLNIPFISTIATIAGICLGIIISQKLFHKILINKKIFYNDALDKQEERALLNKIKPLIFEKIQPKNEILKKRFDNLKFSAYKIAMNLILCQIFTIVLSLNILPLCNFIKSQNIPEFFKSSLEFLKFTSQEIIKFIFDFFENKLGIDFINKDNLIIAAPILLISIALLGASLVVLNNFFNSEKDKGAILNLKNDDKSLKNLNYDDKDFKIISLNKIIFSNNEEINKMN